MFSTYFTVILTVIFRVHHLPLHLADVILLPPGVGGDADLQGGVEEPEPVLVGGDADLQEGVEEPELVVELFPILPSSSRFSETRCQNKSGTSSAHGQDR